MAELWPQPGPLSLSTTGDRQPVNAEQAAASPASRVAGVLQTQAHPTDPENPLENILLQSLFCSVFLNRFLQNNKIRLISSKAFAGLSQLKML